MATYSPFSTVGPGNIFYISDRPNVPLMKTGSKSAVLLAGYWDHGKLHPRGTVVQCAETLCAILPEQGEFILSTVKADPLDPRRRFWRKGDTIKVGERLKETAEVFAGLFVYSGFGTGNYYSATENEILVMEPGEAHSLAKSERVEFVYFDHSAGHSLPPATQLAA